MLGHPKVLFGTCQFFALKNVLFFNAGHFIGVGLGELIFHTLNFDFGNGKTAPKTLKKSSAVYGEAAVTPRWSSKFKSGSSRPPKKHLRLAVEEKEDNQGPITV